MMEQVCWNAGVIPIERRRLWGGVQNVKFTNMSDLGVNSSLAQQSPTVQQLLKVSQHAATHVMMMIVLCVGLRSWVNVQVPKDVVACTAKDALSGGGG